MIFFVVLCSFLFLKVFDGLGHFFFNDNFSRLFQSYLAKELLAILHAFIKFKMVIILYVQLLYFKINFDNQTRKKNLTQFIKS